MPFRWAYCCEVDLCVTAQCRPIVILHGKNQDCVYHYNDRDLPVPANAMNVCDIGLLGYPDDTGADICVCHLHTPIPALSADMNFDCRRLPLSIRSNLELCVSESGRLQPIKALLLRQDLVKEVQGQIRTPALGTPLSKTLDLKSRGFTASPVYALIARFICAHAICIRI